MLVVICFHILCNFVVAEQEISRDACGAHIPEQESDWLSSDSKDLSLSLLQRSATSTKKTLEASAVDGSIRRKSQNGAAQQNNVTTFEFTYATMMASDAYILVSTATIFAMSIPGLPLLYGGLAQSKHAVSVMAQCLGVGGVVSILWYIVGYSLSFSGDSPWIGNLDQFMLLPLTRNRYMVYNHPSGPLPETVYFLFEMAFAVITPMLIVGAWAERARFAPAVAFCGLWSLLVYCPLAHWIWGNGWLQTMGVRDFAGGLVVHLSAGSAALVVALSIPARPGFPNNVEAPHSMTVVIAGLGIIWLGWFGFNGASALSSGAQAGMTMLCTQVAAVVALLVWMAIQSSRSKPTLESIVCGVIAGLGSITPASGYVGPIGAMMIGVLASFATYFAWYVCKERGFVDDALDVFPIHGVGGAVGTIMTAVGSSEALGGVGYSAGVGFVKLLGVQCLGCLVTFLWSAAISFVILKVLDGTVGFCHEVSAIERKHSLDKLDHDGEAYSCPQQ